MVDTSLNNLESKLSNLTVGKKMNKNTVHIGDISLKTTTSDLKELFKDYKCTSVNLKKTANEQYAFAFVTFETEDYANKAIEDFKYKKLNGKELIISSCSNAKKYTDDSNVFVNKIPLDMNAVDLEKIFKNFGHIIKCKIVRNKDGTSKGYGYVMYKNSKSAKKAVEYCQDVQINGQKLVVEMYNTEKLHRNTETESFTNCFCKNFPSNFTEEKLREMLEKYGKITSIYMPLRADKSAVGFACVNFEKAEDAIKAIENCHNKSFFTNEEMGKDKKFAVEPFYIQKNEKKTEREQMLKGVYGNNTNYRSKLKKNLFIKNVPVTFSEEETLKVLQQYGKIVDFKLNKDQMHPDKQFGFVCYSTLEEAALALEKSKKILLDGSQLELLIYKSKFERENESSFIKDLNLGGGKIEEKKVLDTLFDMLFAQAKNFKNIFEKVGAKTEKEFADILCKKMSGLNTQVLREYVSNPKKLNDFIEKEILKN